MEQQIRFCTARDGVRIAYASIGSGPPLVKAANWLSHLEFDWRSPVWRHWLESLSAGRRLIRYDERGNGLSDWDVEDISFEAVVGDLEAVVDALSLDRFALFGMSQGGPVAATYAVRHPERVTHLVLFNSFARGRAKRGPAAREELETQLALTKHGWGKDDPAYRQVFTTQLMPEATREQMRWFNDLQRLSASPENAIRLQEVMAHIDVADLLPRVSVPTLVLHCRDDVRVPFEAGRHLAALIPNARFVPLEGQNHLPQPEDHCWEPLITEVRRFLGGTDQPLSVFSTPSVGPAAPAVPHPASQAADPIAREACGLIVDLQEVRLSRFSVVGGYTRYDETARHALKDVLQRIVAGFDGPTRTRENHLLWGAPGTGKTYFVQQIAASLQGAIRYHEINLAKWGEAEVRSRLEALDVRESSLCLVDEIDAKPLDSWPYEILLPYLDATAEGRAQFVFVLAGSSASSLAEMKQRIATRPKGTDLLSRVPSSNEYEIPPLSSGDRLLVVLTQLRQAAEETGRKVRAVEKFGLYYAALHPGLASARQLREFAVRAVERVPKGDDRVRYDHLFSPGDPENKAFWVRALPLAGALGNKFTEIDA